MEHLSPELKEIFSSGEVLHPDAPNITPLFSRHVAGYRACMPSCEGKTVLDVGTGEGYGSAMLSEVAAQVASLEFTPALAAYAQGRHGSDKLRFLNGSAEALPFADASFEVVTSLQLIEHLPDYPAFIREAWRVLQPGGVMVTVTPNRRTMLSGLNPYHFTEFDPEELRAAVAEVFPEVQALGLFGSEAYLALKRDEQAFARKILALDPLNIRSKLPRWLLYVPYRMAFLLVNKRTEQNEDEASKKITEADFTVSADNLPQALEAITVATKPA